MPMRWSSCSPARGARAVRTPIGFWPNWVTRDDIVALAYHIDYWDYIGWQDTFACPATPSCKRAMREAWGKNRIYTPQMVVNGAHGGGGFGRTQAENVISAASMPLEISLSLPRRWANRGYRSVPPANGAHRTSVVWLVHLPRCRGSDHGAG